MFNCSDSMSLHVQMACILPEYVNFILLIVAVYGMYLGIEINHPLYAILFLDLVVALLFTLVNIFGFFVVKIEKFIVVSNASNGLSLFFHFTCWCLASCIRFVYIAHNDWIHRVIPSPKNQYYLAVFFAIICWLSLSAPLFLYGMYLGKKLN